MKILSLFTKKDAALSWGRVLYGKLDTVEVNVQGPGEVSFFVYSLELSLAVRSCITCFIIFLIRLFSALRLIFTRPTMTLVPVTSFAHPP